MNNFAEQDRKEAECAERAYRAQAATAQALERLLPMAELRDSGQIRTVAHFIAATFDGQTFPFDLFDLRTVDVEISDDMLLCSGRQGAVLPLPAENSQEFLKSSLCQQLIIGSGSMANKHTVDPVIFLNFGRWTAQ